MSKRLPWKCGKCGYIRRTVNIPTTACKCGALSWQRTGKTTKITARLVEDLFVLKSKIVPEIVAEIQRLPEEIKAKNEEVFALGRGLREIRKTKEHIENQIVLSVLRNKEDYTNEMMRKAEIERRKLFEPVYKNAMESESALEIAVDEAKNEAEYLKNRFSGLRYVIKFLAEVE